MSNVKNNHLLPLQRVQADAPLQLEQWLVATGVLTEKIVLLGLTANESNGLLYALVWQATNKADREKRKIHE